MAKTLTLVSVKCDKPSSGINMVAQGIFAAVGAAIAGTATFVAGATTGGLLIAATGVAAAGGASAGVAVINGLDTVFSGADDLYVKINEQKIWPKDKKHGSIDSQQTVNINYSLPLTGSVTISVWDYDTISSDDKLGYLNLGPDHQTGSFTYLVQSPSEGSIYELNIKITE